MIAVQRQLEEAEAKRKKVIPSTLPPQFTHLVSKKGNLVVTLTKAQGLAPANAKHVLPSPNKHPTDALKTPFHNKPTSAYCSFTLEGGAIARLSQVITKSNSPHWRETLAALPCAPSGTPSTFKFSTDVNSPLEGEKLIVTVFDRAASQFHDFIDEVIIPLDKLQLHPGQTVSIIAPLKHSPKESSLHLDVTYNPAE